jgi:hypothetical protein
MSKYVPKAEETKMDPWQSLANAIVILAAKDYRAALRRLRRNPKSKTALSEIADLERFFRSDWYAMLTNVPGETLIRKLKEE